MLNVNETIFLDFINLFYKLGLHQSKVYKECILQFNQKLKSRYNCKQLH